MLPALLNGASLKAVRLAILDPRVPAFRNRDTLAVGCMDAVLDLVRRGDVPRVSFLFCAEGFQATLPVLVDVIDDPCLVLLIAGGPSSFPDAHFSPPPSLTG